MKKSLKLIPLLLISWTCNYGQISLDTIYNINGLIRIIHLEKSGYKYYFYDDVTKQIHLYNIDNSVFKQINIPTQTAAVNSDYVFYLSETLFNTDSNDIEYLYDVEINSLNYPYVTIYDELGTVLLHQDSAGAYGSLNGLSKYGDVFNTDSGTKLILSQPYANAHAKYIYNLPGKLSCVPCNGNCGVFATVNNFDVDLQSYLPYPNPTAKSITIPYFLPANIKTAVIEIYDNKGALVNNYIVDHTFNQLVLSANIMQSGVYFYNITANGKKLSAGKFIINK
jgi:hypothetical protein